MVLAEIGDTNGVHGMAGLGWFGQVSVEASRGCTVLAPGPGPTRQRDHNGLFETAEPSALADFLRVFVKRSPQGHLCQPAS